MKNLLTYLLAILAFASCSESGIESGGSGGGQETPKQPEITLSTTAANFTTDGGTDVITFTSSEAWTAEVINSRADEWCSIDPKSGAAGSAKITVTTTANDTPDDRTASIIIKAGTASKTINVSQKQKDALTVTSSKFEVSAEGGEITIEVKANINFDFEIDDDAEDWITHRSTRALKTSQLVFEIDENEDTENRKANISISSGNLRETVTIYQEGNEPTIVLSDDEFTVSSSKETIAIDVKSNVDVAVEIPSNVKWIKENTTRAFSTNTYYFDIEQNDGYDNRTAEIKFTNKENGIYEKVKITQMQRDAIVIADSEYTFDENGGELDFEIKTNVEFKVSISSDAQSWIKQVDTRGLQSKTLHFNIAANNTDNDREGTITLSGGDAKQIIKVKQVVTPCQIIYTSTDGKIITPNTTAFGGAKIVSNVYENGQGVITFDRTITSIPNNAFKSQTKLVTISLPESVTSIGDYAFSDCTRMTTISASGTTSVGRYAFYNCAKLKDIPFSNNLKTIDSYAFQKCVGLTYVDLPNATTINSCAFDGCTNMTSIKFPKLSGIIQYALLRDCTSLTNVVIPNGVNLIRSNAFDGCTSLTTVRISDSIREIEYRAFHLCCSLTSITIPASVTIIGSEAFSGCKSLNSVYITDLTAWCNINFEGSYDNTSSATNPMLYGAKLYLNDVLLENLFIPDGVEKINDCAFYGCTSIKSVTISDSVTKIGRRAFRNCVSLSNITIPDSVTEIKREAFYGCSSLINATIPTSVVNMEDQIFSGCTSLEDITIPNSVEKIGSAAFYGCTALTNIVLPESITEICTSTFKGCTSLTSVTIPNNVTSIAGSAFESCALTSVTIPKNVRNIWGNAFYSCKLLKEVYCEPTTPPSLNSEKCFGYNASGRKFYVPIESIDTYKTADGWKSYTSSIVGYDFDGESGSDDPSESDDDSELENPEDGGTTDW